MNLTNEPVLKRITPAVLAAALVGFLAAIGVLTSEQATALLTLLGTLGVGAAGVSARAAVYGPVTFDRATSPAGHPDLPVDYYEATGSVDAAAQLDDIPDGPAV